MRPLPSILLLLLLAAAPEAAAAEPRIRDLTAVESEGLVSVEFRLEGAFEAPEIRRAIESGLPTVLTYEVVLIRKYPNWFDARVARSRIEVIATYNSVTREYLLNYRRDRKLVRSEIVPTIEELQRKMATVREADLFSIGDHKPWKLRVRTRAELMRRYVWYIIPWDVATPWEEERVRRRDAAEGAAP
ncbi:MAG TPA: DUF4390 domain-containing protein [Thermoanaerobaculia bacterium]|nr:DUF4390 domain-containing protein [Thermoanaerobaculia bacterium]